jgi:hypothetical protein
MFRYMLSSFYEENTIYKVTENIFSDEGVKI